MLTSVKPCTEKRCLMEKKSKLTFRDSVSTVKYESMSIHDFDFIVLGPEVTSDFSFGS